MSLPKLFKQIRPLADRTQLIRTATSFCCLVTAIILFNCGDNDGSSNANTQLVPHKKGNLWVYDDTDTSVDGHVSSKTDTVTVTDNYTRNDTAFWEIHDPYSRYISILPISQQYQFVTRGDTIFRKFHTIDKSNKKYSYLVKTYAPAPATGSFTYKTGGIAYTEITVIKLPSPVVTPAGTFNSCYQYTYSNPNENVEEIICPGIGVIRMREWGEVRHDNAIQTWQHARTLIHYRLQRL